MDDPILGQAVLVNSRCIHVYRMAEALRRKRHNFTHRKKGSYMKRWLVFVFGALVAASISSCGGGGGGSASGSSTETVTGSVVKSYVSGATITFYSLNSNGTRGNSLGSSTTGADGSFSVSLSSIPSTPFLAESSGGTYVDEVTAATEVLSNDDHLCAVLPGGTASAAITSLTHMACVRALVIAANGINLEAAVNSVNSGIAQQFNLTNIISVLPVDASNSGDNTTAALDARLYGIVLAGIAQEASTLGVSALDLTTALAEDASDGILDGLNNGAGITIPNSVITLSASAALTGLQNAIDAFLLSGNNQTNVTVTQVLTNAVTIGINTAGSMYTTSTVLPAWTYDVAGSAQISVAGGTAPYTCALSSGSLPTGLALNPDCTISGTVAGPGVMTIFSPFTVAISDSAAVPSVVDVSLYVTVIAPGPTITAVTSGSCYTGMECTVQIATASGGIPTLYFTSDTFANGTPPLGMIIDLNGNLTGTAPENERAYSFGVCVVDALGAQDCTTTSVEIVAPGVEIFDGSYTGNYSGTAIDPELGSASVSGTTSVTISNGVIVGSSDSGDVSGTVNAAGTVTMGVVASDCLATFSGSLSVSEQGVATGSGAWSCLISGGGSASGTWNIAR
ncbi:MAG TPA: hypothetical protein VIM41_17135 [Gammaproteobacteria bacterium]